MRILLSSLLLTLSLNSAFSQTFSSVNTNLSNRSSDWVSLALIDVDNDYLVDVWAGSTSGNHSFFYATDSLVYQPDPQSPFTNFSGFGSSWADMDNDCDIDAIFVNRYSGGNNPVYQNNGSNFSSVTSGLLYTEAFRGVDSKWADFDNYGSVDLFIAQRSTSNGSLENALYLNQGNFTFNKKDTGDVVLDQNISRSASYADYNLDGHLDIFVANAQNQANGLYKNMGGGFFMLDTGSVVLQDYDQSASGCWGDYNNDGYPDLYVANMVGEKNRLYENNGDGTFTKITTGGLVNTNLMTISAEWGDFDNDGDLDLFTANASNAYNKRNILYRNNGNSTFTAITSGPLYNSFLSTFATAVTDLNDDGYLDILNANRYSSNLKLFINDGGANSHAKFYLHGSISNEQGIGARVIIKTSQGKQYRTARTSNSMNSYNDGLVHFGLGQDTIIDSLWIEWPGGGKCAFADVPADQLFNIGEAGCVLDSAPEAHFSDSSSYLNAYFPNTSTGDISSYKWYFGDGDSSTTANPVHTYSSPGKYEVTLIAYDNFCKHSVFKDSIEICPDTSTIGFINTNKGLQLTVTDTSTSNAYLLAWDFGDNTTAIGPVSSHTYSQAGTYQVCLTLTDSCRSKQYCQNITVCNDTLVADFSATGSGYSKIFNDSSVNATSVSWDFGDGTSATGSNPTHIYSSPGQYYVCQTVQDACTSTTFCDTVEVCTEALISDFSFTANGNVLTFNDNSTNANSYYWDFGDGDFSTQQNPTHLFTNFGTYTVCLVVTNDCFSDTLCQQVVVCSKPSTAAYNYSSSTISPLIIQFQDQSSNATSYLWDFGDGSTSTKTDPLKAFGSADLFEVCLTITDSCGGSDTTCQQVDLTPFSIEEMEWLNALSIYPNPTSEILFVESSKPGQNNLELTIFDLHGKKLDQRTYAKAPTRSMLDLSQLPNGVYLLEINSEGLSRTEKIIKN